MFLKENIGNDVRLNLMKLLWTCRDQTWPQYWSQKGPKVLKLSLKRSKLRLNETVQDRVLHGLPYQGF